MEFLQTVTGKIMPEKIGITLVHEHLLWDQRFNLRQISDENGDNEFLKRKICMHDLGKIKYNMHAHIDNIYQCSIDEAIEELTEFKLAGGRTICDCSVYGIGRDPKAIFRIANATGINILMGTGLYIENAYPNNMRDMEKKQYTKLFIDEIKTGVGNTGIKAGFIGEIGISEAFSHKEKEVLAAAAIAQKETGSALLIHQPGFVKRANEILDIISKNGGNLEKTIMCHCDPTLDDVQYHESIIKRGAIVSFDQFGLEFIINIAGYKNRWLPRDSERIQAIIKHIQKGNCKNVVMSQDICFKACYKKYGGYGYSHIIDNIIPLLKDLGVDNDTINEIMIENPKRIFKMND